VNMRTPIGRNPVVVLVDGENLPAQHAPAVLARAATLGDPIVRRVYGNVTLIPGWDKIPEFAFIHTGSGKNSADIKLVVDAMNLAQAGRAEQFLLVSADSDFRHLADALREKGLAVFGMGEAKASQILRAACCEFDVLTTGATEIMASAKPAVAAKKSKAPAGASLDQHLKQLIEENGGSAGMKINELNALIRRETDVKISELAEKTWRGYLTGRPHLFQCDPKGCEARVRLVRA